MNVSNIIQFLIGEMPPTEFQKLVEEEVNEYKKLLAKKGSVIPIKINEDTEYLFKKEGMIILIEAYINDELCEYTVYYILDALVLSERILFEDEELCDLATSLTDPEINRHLTKALANEVLLSLKN